MSEETNNEDYEKMIRHDLKNKMQITRGYLELMEDYELPEGSKDLLKKAMNSTKESQELLDKWKLKQDQKEGKS